MILTCIFSHFFPFYLLFLITVHLDCLLKWWRAIWIKNKKSLIWQEEAFLNASAALPNGLQRSIVYPLLFLIYIIVCWCRKMTWVSFWLKIVCRYRKMTWVSFWLKIVSRYRKMTWVSFWLKIVCRYRKILSFWLKIVCRYRKMTWVSFWLKIVCWYRKMTWVSFWF